MGIRTNLFLLQGKVSKLASEIWINNKNSPIVILWKSKSGRVYDTSDSDIDCTDIDFWFEGLDQLLYHQQMYPKTKHPFKLKELNYELIVTRLNIDCKVEMQLKKENVLNASEIIHKTDKFIEDFNTTSVKNN